MKAAHIFSLLLLTVCLLIPFEPVYRYVAESSTPIYQTEPCIRWGDWTVGQSPGSGNAVVTTFITNSEKTACVKADVKYCASQPSAYVYPIKSFDFEITMNNGFTVRKQVETTSGPAASEFSPNTTFSVEAMLEGPADTTQVRICDDLNGRSNTAMAVTIKFKGYYGSDAENQKTVTLTKTWTQDTVDMLRQEYVDMTPPDGRAELPVPGRGQFKSEISSNGVDDWNTGHYSYMIDVSLKAKKSAWLTEVNNYRKANTLSVFTDKQFKVNSAYRNPYHQRFHVNARQGKVASFHSRHCYGDALDIHTLDVDSDSTVEQVVGNKAQSDDGVLMEERADDAGALWTASYEYYSSHTHADWRLRRSDGGSWPPAAGTVYSPPCKMPAETLSSPPAGSVTPSPTPTPSPSYHPCGVHQTSVSGSHSQRTYTCGSHSGYACQESNDHKTYIASCSETENGRTCNNSSGYYECSPHSHTYPAPPPPAPTTVACGGAPWTNCPGASSRKAHHVPSCSHCNNGYWTCGQYAYRHTTQNTCRRPGCGVTYYECQNGPCSSDWGTYDWHWATE